MQKSSADLSLLKLWIHDNLKTVKIKKGAMLARLSLQHSDQCDNDNMKDPRAFCFAVKGSPVIRCSSVLELIDRRHRVGVLLHEIGHVVLDAFNASPAEVDVDSWCRFDVVQSGYGYSDLVYRSPWTDELVTAKALQAVKGDFLWQLDTLSPDDV